jgi:hypothetical protein
LQRCRRRRLRAEPDGQSRTTSEKSCDRDQEVANEKAKSVKKRRFSATHLVSLVLRAVDLAVQRVPLLVELL